jgi:protein-L-isoaspartate(D-aspartate) O-methyltransferase
MDKIKDMEKIINIAPERMHRMLDSVYRFNNSFLINKKNKKAEKESLLERILFAMSIIDRKFFVDDENFETYLDTALPIKKGQTISQPSTVARMIMLADLKQGDDVLEIGAGSGWNAALISFLVYPGKVASVDRVNTLIKNSLRNISELRSNLKQISPQNVKKLSKINFFCEDIFQKGVVWKRKHDKIIFTAGIENKEQEKQIKELAKDLLKKQGILVCPKTIGPMIYLKKQDNGAIEMYETKEHYGFVPLLKGKEK